MNRLKQCAACLLLALACAVAPLDAQTPARPEQQDEFVPVTEVPPEDRLPAAPMVIGAYAFVTLALFGYVLSVSRRLGGVKRDIERLEADLKRTGRG